MIAILKNYSKIISFLCLEDYESPGPVDPCELLE